MKLLSASALILWSPSVSAGAVAAFERLPYCRDGWRRHRRQLGNGSGGARFPESGTTGDPPLINTATRICFTVSVCRCGCERRDNDVSTRII
ncbi:unnamed protein product [Nippostrongylus brasiliensis]|uniref:Secreted protein n=1 Tax=Nippostrongylus brasiliensis TaxID=27835 RepID=A0A0N4Y1H1_NIPBR|nr:unnamed protein product [Nippostrongylus brasiliensis]